MNTPLLAIERIAESPDRRLAVKFFLFFSRYEYALKRAEYIDIRPDKSPNPDWDKYARAKPDLLKKITAEEFSKAVDFLKKNPPRKQIVKEKKLDWAPDCYSDEVDLARLLVLVRRIRNNLFHGGKFEGGPESDVCRDEELLKVGLIIMQYILHEDIQLHNFFLEDLG